MTISKNIKFLITATLLGSATVWAVANTPTLKSWIGLQTVPVVAEEAAEKKDPQQEALLKEFSGLLTRFDSTNTSFYLGGLLSAIDRTDSANALNNFSYRYGKWGQQLYVKTGDKEVLNSSEQYIYVDHAAKKIMVTPGKLLYEQPVLPLNELYKHIRSEGFTVEKKAEGGSMLNIRLISPTHISLKGISISYDSISRDVRKIVVRQAEVADPMNEHKEKWITLDIKEWKDEPARKDYPVTGDFLKKKNGRWECAAAFKEYELMDQTIQ